MKDATRASLWDRRMARHLVATGEWELLGEVKMPWPSLVMVASKEALYAKSGAVKHFVHFAHDACDRFKVNKDEESTSYIAARHGLNAEEASDFIADTVWNCDFAVKLESVQKPLEHLRRTGLLPADRGCDTGRFLAKELCKLSNMPAPPSAASALPVAAAAIDSAGASPAVTRKSEGLLDDEEDHFFGFPLSQEATAVTEATAVSNTNGVECFTSVAAAPQEDKQHAPVPAG